MARKREKTETGRIYCDFFAEHLILDNFSRVNVVKMLNPSQKIMKVPMQNTPPQIFGFFCLAPQKLQRSKEADNHNPQKFLSSNSSENFIHWGVWILNGQIELPMSITQMSKFKRNS